MNDGSSQPHREGVWARLRRRKLVQWSIAYIAAAWGLLQGIAFLRDTFGWSHQFQQAATVLLLICLPVVLVLAWYHGERGEQEVTRRELAILTLLFLTGGGTFWYYQNSTHEPEASIAAQSSAVPPSAPEVAIPTDRSIAVLPFMNMSSDKEQEYFADGISEELLNLLAQVSELRVVARTSSFSFKGKDVDIAEIARKLGVANVLEGSVRKSGDRIRITAQLVRASDSSHLWSQTYDRQLTDVFAVQDEIAAAVVDGLKIHLMGEVPKTRTADPAAYTLFLQARAISRQYTKLGFEQAIDLYHESLAIDPTYAATWAGLATTYLNQVDYGHRVPNEGSRLAREATGRALALDPQSAETHALLGWIAIDHGRDYAGAARHIGLALSLDPANATVLNLAGLLNRRLMRFDEAIRLFKLQVSRDPVDADALDALGYAYRYAGRLDEAIAAYRTALDLSPGFHGGHEDIGEVLLEKGDPRAALSEMELETDDAIRLCGLAMAHYALGNRAESDAALAALETQYAEVSSYCIASVLAYRGEADKAFEWLDKAAEYGDPVLGSVPGYAMFTKLHSDPRWLPFLRKHGMAPEQLAAIKFDVTLPN